MSDEAIKAAPKAAAKESTDKVGLGSKIGNAFKDVIPDTTAGKIIGTVGVIGLNVGSFFIGRLTKGGKKKKD